MTPAEIRNRFGFHKATLEGPEATGTKHATLRARFMGFATLINHELPEGREKALAFTALEEASMWAHKAIAQKDPLEDESHIFRGDN